MSTMQHSDYIATVEYDPDISMFHGRIVNIRDVVTFYGASVDDLKHEFEVSLRTYLDFCKEKGVEPAKPFSGNLNLRLGPERHSRVAAAAAATGKSINSWLLGVIDSETKTP